MSGRMDNDSTALNEIGFNVIFVLLVPFRRICCENGIINLFRMNSSSLNKWHISEVLTRNVTKNPFWTRAPSTLLHSWDMPGLRAVKDFTFNKAHVFGDVNETNVCKYNANAKLSKCVSDDWKKRILESIERWAIMEIKKQQKSFIYRASVFPCTCSICAVTLLCVVSMRRLVLCSTLPQCSWALDFHILMMPTNIGTNAPSVHYILATCV